MERRDGDHVSIAREVGVLDRKGGFLKRQNGKVALGVAVVVNLDVRPGDALEISNQN